MAVPRLDADSTKALADARERARALHHDVVDVEHVLAALLAIENVPIAIGAAFVSRPELVRRLEALLMARATRSLYRDADPTRPLSTRLIAALQRAADMRGLRFYRPVSTVQLLNALLADREIIEITITAALDATDAGILIDRAKTRAKERSHDVVVGEHVLLAALETDWFAAAARAVGQDPDALAPHLEIALTRHGVGAPRDVPTLSPEVLTLIRTAAAQASSTGTERITPERLVGHVFRSRAHLFRSAGISRTALLHAMIGSDVAAAVEHFDPQTEVDVVFHNDDFTTMEFVLSVLKQEFDLSDADATAIMIRVHRTGEAVAARLYADDARDRVIATSLRAEEEGMPLRLSLRASSLR